jgi:hypothetical protein
MVYPLLRRREVRRRFFFSKFAAGWISRRGAPSTILGRVLHQGQGSVQPGEQIGRKHAPGGCRTSPFVMPLDAAAAAAYGFPADLTDEQILEKLLALNLARAAEEAEEAEAAKVKQPKTQRERQTDELV